MILDSLNPYDLFNFNLNIETLIIMNYNNIVPSTITWNHDYNHHIRKLILINMDNMSIQFLNYLQQYLDKLEWIHLYNYKLANDNENVQNHFKLFKEPFSTAQNLKSISINHCGIRSLAGVNLLNNVITLRTLSLAHNELTEIDNPKFFPKKSESFWYLDLSYNHLKSISDLPLLKSITELHLENNNIIQLPDNLYKLPNLKIFWFQGKFQINFNSNSNCFHFLDNIEKCQNVQHKYHSNIPEIFVC